MGVLDGRVALVTGATGGIGRGIVDALVDAGAQVVAAARRLFEPWRAGVVAAVADLRDPTAGAVLVDAALLAFGGLDVLVHGAGVQDTGPLADATDEDWQAMLDVNVLAAQRLLRAALPAFEPRGSGAVVYVASIEASTPAPDHGVYAVSKAALVMHAKAAALELGPRGVRVNCVSPGLVARPGIEDEWPEGVARYRAAAPLGRLGTPADVGAACVFLCSPDAAWITGVDLTVDGGVSVHPHW